MSYRENPNIKEFMEELGIDVEFPEGGNIGFRFYDEINDKVYGYLGEVSKPNHSGLGPRAIENTIYEEVDFDLSGKPYFYNPRYFETLGPVVLGFLGKTGFKESIIEVAIDVYQIGGKATLKEKTISALEKRLGGDFSYLNLDIDEDKDRVIRFSSSKENDLNSMDLDQREIEVKHPINPFVYGKTGFGAMNSFVFLPDKISKLQELSRELWIIARQGVTPLEDNLSN